MIVSVALWYKFRYRRLSIHNIFGTGRPASPWKEFISSKEPEMKLGGAVREALDHRIIDESDKVDVEAPDQEVPEAPDRGLSDAPD